MITSAAAAALICRWRHEKEAWKMPNADGGDEMR